MPDVSIIIPTRDRVERLRRAVDSVLAQAGVDIELVVVDDGSTDSTPAYLEDLSRRDERVRVVRNDASHGAAAARNVAATRARAPLIAFNDDDCIWEPTKLRVQRERMRDTGAGVVYCRQVLDWPGHGLVVSGGPGAERRGAVRDLATGNYIGTPSPLIRRRLFVEAGGFDERLVRLQDWDLWLTLGTMTHFAFVPRVLVRGEHVEGGITSSRQGLVDAARLMLEKWSRDGRLSRRDKARLHYGIGKFLLGDGLARDARHVFREGVRIDPRSPLAWFGLFGSLLGPRPFDLLKRARIAARRVRAS